MRGLVAHYRPVEKNIDCLRAGGGQSYNAPPGSAGYSVRAAYAAERPRMANNEITPVPEHCYFFLTSRTWTKIVDTAVRTMRRIFATVREIGKTNGMVRFAPFFLHSAVDARNGGANIICPLCEHWAHCL